MDGHLLSPFALSRILPVGGNLSILCSLPGPPVLRELMAVVAMVPGQGGRFWSVVPLTLSQKIPCLLADLNPETSHPITFPVPNDSGVPIWVPDPLASALRRILLHETQNNLFSPNEAPAMTPVGTAHNCSEYIHAQVPTDAQIQLCWRLHPVRSAAGSPRLFSWM